MNAVVLPYRLYFEPRPQYLYVEIEAGRIDRDTALEYWGTIIEKCRELTSRRLLVWQDVPVGLSLGDTFTVAGGIAAMGVAGIRIAFTDALLSHYDMHQFGALVAGNRGLDAEVFTDLGEAERWLLRES